MSNSLQLPSLTSLTMSSVDIAELTGKRHSDVLESIRKVLNEVDIDSAEFSAQYKDSTGRALPCFNLPRRECDLVIAGYSAKYRLAIIDRWQELENQQAFQLPNFSNPVEAARAWANEVEQKQAVKVERDQALLQVESQKQTIQHKDDLIRVSNEASVKAGEMLIREFVKSVDIIDLGEKQFYQWMRDQGLIMESREPYQPYVNRGFFTWKPTEVKHGSKYRYTLRVTPRGKVWLAAKYMAYVDSLEFTALGNGEAA